MSSRTWETINALCLQLLRHQLEAVVEERGQDLASLNLKVRCRCKEEL